MSLIVIPARAKARRVASTGPRPMISGLSALTPVATIRASGVRPSSAARWSLMITTAAAPSLSGQQLPAGPVPPGDRGDLGREEPGRDGPFGPVLGPDPELVLVGPADAAQGGHVLGGLAHGDVHVGQPSVRPRVVPRLVAGRVRRR